MRTVYGTSAENVIAWRYPSTDLQDTLFDAGAGNDTVVFTYDSSIILSVDLRLTTPQPLYKSTRSDTFLGFENAEIYLPGLSLATLYGTDGANWLHILNDKGRFFGNGGDDLLTVDTRYEALVDGGAGIDTLQLGGRYGGTADTVSLALAGQAQAVQPGGLMLTLKGIENLAGSYNDETLIGDGGANVLAGGGGSDTLVGGAGNDILAGDGEYRLSNGQTGTIQFVRAVAGNVGTDLLEGGLGNDILNGGAGLDTAVYSHAAGAVTVDLAAGTASGADGNDRLTLIENVIGSDHADNITGSAFANDLDGGKGADRMAGGLGDDTYHVDDAGDQVVEAAGGGKDIVLAGISYTLADNAENLTLVGTDAINGTGNALDNVLTGNDAANRLAGGAGNDTYRLQTNIDKVIEGADAGIDAIYVPFSYKLGANQENLILTGNGLNGTGNELDNTIYGGWSARLVGGAGNDSLHATGPITTMIGGTGDDIYYLWDNADTIVELAGEGTDTVVVGYYGYNMNNAPEIENARVAADLSDGGGIVGNALDNVITGNDFRNYLVSSGGHDTLIGGKGNDEYTLTTSATIIEQKGEGIDQVTALVDFILPANVENLQAGGSAKISLTGNALGNVIIGNGADNVLNGKGGADIMTGGFGNDTYYVDNVGDVVNEDGERTALDKDKVIASIDYTLGFGVTNLTLIGKAVSGTGNWRNNTITGNALANVLDGKDGADTMAGGAGNDTYHVDNTGDLVREAANAGTDTVLVGDVDYTLTSNVEMGMLVGSAAVNLAGNALANDLTGNDAANVLDGKGGADRMTGGGGDDVYMFDNAGDVAIELAGGGIDTVQSNATTVLSANFENLVLTGSAPLDGTGNELDNVITGNRAANRLEGLGGNDTLAGGGGADVLVGGKGDDGYVVGNAGVQVVELAEEGHDTVRASLSYTLAGNVEDLVLLGNAAIDGTGNASANTITGNAAANVLDGGAGADTLIGGGGYDTYVVDNAGDTASGTGLVKASVSFTLVEVNDLTLIGNAVLTGTGNDNTNHLTGNAAASTLVGKGGDDVYFVTAAGTKIVETAGGGTDVVHTSINLTLADNVEVGAASDTAAITLTGNALANALAGNSAANVLDGGDGADVLAGFLGNDTLVGGAGDDLLVGGDGSNSLSGGAGKDSFVVFADDNQSATDTISDFVSGTDTLIVVNPYVSGFLLAGGFVIGTQALDDNDVGIYDKSSGKLYADFDANGPGAKVLIAQFNPGTTLAASDIELALPTDLNAGLGPIQALLEL